jgi:ATP-dependent 26S proteasome regulatory subunit
MRKLRAMLAPVILGRHTQLETPEETGAAAAVLKGFKGVGGHSEHVQALKEMVLLPLVYPDMFEALQVKRTSIISL